MHVSETKTTNRFAKISGRKSSIICAKLTARIEQPKAYYGLQWGMVSFKNCTNVGLGGFRGLLYRPYDIPDCQLTCGRGFVVVGCMANDVTTYGQTDQQAQNYI